MENCNPETKIFLCSILMVLGYKCIGTRTFAMAKKNLFKWEQWEKMMALPKVWRAGHDLLISPPTGFPIFQRALIKGDSYSVENLESNQICIFPQNSLSNNIRIILTERNLRFKRLVSSYYSCLFSHGGHGLNA